MKNKNIRNQILNLLLPVSFLIGIYMHFTMPAGSSINNQWLTNFSTLALISAFFNIYLTTKRSKWFIIPDVLWIIFTFATLFITKNYSDLTLYIFYFFVGFYQFFQWSSHEKNGEVIIKRYDKFVNYYLLIGLLITTIQIFSIKSGNNILLGSIISGFGIVGSILVANRYYFAEIVYIIVNILQIILFISSNLYQLSLIPLVFLVHSIIFIIFNKPNDN